MKNGFLGFLAILLVLAFIGCGGNDTDDTEFTVTFDLDGGNINGNTASVQIKVKSGETIASLPNPQKSENSIGFGGWYTQKYGLGNEFTTATTVSSNLTIFAKWENPFVGKWANELYDTWIWEFFADLTWVTTQDNINGIKGTYSFNATENNVIYTHYWDNSSWIDLIEEGEYYIQNIEYVINNNQMTTNNAGTWIKQN